MSDKQKKILIIGAGNMGYAIIEGIIDSGFSSPKNLIVVEKNTERAKSLRKKKINVVCSIDDLHSKDFLQISFVLIAVKPNDVNDVLTQLKGKISSTALVSSIAAGIKIKSIEGVFGKKQPICRIMPNTPSQIGFGVNCISFNKNIKKSHKDLLHKMFQVLGETFILEEKYFDAVTAISGSGPAYFCYLVESMIQSGISLGFDPKLAHDLVINTGLGTLLLLKKKNITPKVLRESVTSPKGTTHAAISYFEKHKLNSVIVNGIQKAKDRSVELGKQ